MDTCTDLDANLIYKIITRDDFPIIEHYKKIEMFLHQKIQYKTYQRSYAFDLFFEYLHSSADYCYSINHLLLPYRVHIVNQLINDTESNFLNNLFIKL